MEMHNKKSSLSKMKFLFIVVIGAGLLACSSVSIHKVNTETIVLDSTYSSNASIDSMVQPYKEKMELEMNEVIAFAPIDFIVERPSGTLNNWFADAILTSQIRNARLEAPTFCLLNTGGIRATLNKGNITLGDIFKIAPFDNEVVWVKMPSSSLPKIQNYLKNTGGEPISGARIMDGNLVVDGWNTSLSHVWIITNDYLLKGGDNMDFFNDALETSFSGILVRDALVDEAKRQDTLVINLENRMQF